MTLTKFKPAKSFLSDTFFPSGFDSLFKDLWEENTEAAERYFTPSAEVLEDEEKFQINLIMAGMDKKDVKLDVENNELVVFGEKEERKAEENERYHLREFRSGKFKRRFFLPDVADVDNIEAEMKNGILTINVPKKAKAKAKVISIK